ncbi:SDR family NAD(P)-dependent oxidoreductase [Stella sp.]|uniref:SDR family NAD(P)-dependent oxidoreductase n=1 Tax=Stella sp. TaxID=2912054 RepID=UPI0035B0FE8D
MRLAGRRVLVTGAASGIGRATAELFVAEGARVALADRDRARLETVAGALGPAALAVPCDVADPASVGDAVAAAAAGLGGLDGVVNSAGITIFGHFETMPAADWSAQLAINLTGPFHVCRAAVPHLKAAGGGTIVNIASGAGLRPLAEASAYCTTKAGLIMFGKALAIDLAPAGIRVNAVCPGIVDTPMVAALLDREPDREAAIGRILDRYVIRRFGTAAEMAAAVLYLTSAESGFVTGIALAVDGGRSFH